MSGIVGTSTYNPTSQLTSYGTTSLWVGFGFLLFFGIVFFFLSYIRNVKPEARLTYFLITLGALTSALAYLIMALGDSGRYAHNNQREFLWVRYAQWALNIFVTLPVLALLSGAHWVSLIWTLFAAGISLAGMYSAATNQGFQATWPLFAFAAFCGIPIVIALLFTWRRSAFKVHPEVGKLFTVAAYFFVLLMVLYLITIGVSECGFVTTVDQEVIVYTVADIMSKGVLGFLIIYGRESIARYGTWHGINTGIDIDFPIAGSTRASSGSNYAIEPQAKQVQGEHRDLAFAQLHTATNTGLTRRH